MPRRQRARARIHRLGVNAFDVVAFVHLVWRNKGLCCKIGFDSTTWDDMATAYHRHIEAGKINNHRIEKAKAIKVKSKLNSSAAW